MSTIDTIPQKAILLWLSGVRLAEIRTLPAVEAIMSRGAMVELDPTPITGPQTQHYQLFSGKLPASFGFFDSFVARNYAVTEEINGRGTTPLLLPDLLRTVGWSVDYKETTLTDVATRLQAMAQAATGTPSCLIVKCTKYDSMNDADGAALTQSLQQAQEWLGESGLLALLSDTQPAPVKSVVNVNNFLADMGVIERDEQSGQINWENSLAYFAGNGQLLVNLLGRDPKGAVHPQDEYEEVCETLAKALPDKLRNPENGEAVIERVYRKEELYKGDFLFCAPDLVVLFKEGYAPSANSKRIGFDDATFAVASEAVVAGASPAMLSGFLLASAPTLEERITEYEHASLTAVVPTLLHALGIEYVDMESVAIATLFSPDYLETHPIRSGSHNQELSEEDEELIISHLRDLGYV
jgi:hypothetical protein